MKQVLLKLLCLMVALVMVASFPVAAAPSAEDSDEPALVKEGQFNAVSKGKPEGNPGNGGGGGKPPKEPPGPTVDKWAVVIGIADYHGVRDDLMYPDDDAVDMYNYLLSVGYPPDNVRLLLDNKASARNIQKAISWMGSAEGADSECVFFYSGHGTQYYGIDDGDVEEGGDTEIDEAIVSADLYIILDGQLRSMFAGFESHKISFIFDSCFSGGMDDLAGSGRVVVAASDENQFSWEGDAEMSNGVFTYFFMRGLTAYNTVEGAFEYAAHLARNWVSAHTIDEMDPQMYDPDPWDWGFV